jgi:hypothetical protein
VLAAFALRADEVFVVTNETAEYTLDTRVLSERFEAGESAVAAGSTAFKLDTRLLPDRFSAGDSAVVIESDTFALDTRLTEAAPSWRAVYAETTVFTLDTRLVMEGGITAGLIVAFESDAFLLNTLDPPVRESGVFTLDTRLLAARLGEDAPRAVVESESFALDTRLLSEQTAASNALVIAESVSFALDTRLLSAQAGDLDAAVMAESVNFVLDTRLLSVRLSEAGRAVAEVSAPFLLNTRNNADADEDGLPDVWEVAVFGDRATAGPGTDFDGDGMRDGDERVAGTDAKNKEDCFAVRWFSVEGCGSANVCAVVGWSSASNRVYDLQRGPCGSPDFVSVVTNIVATPPLNVVTDRVSAAQSRWYRVWVREP